jgi:serine/threonine-protein kinase
VSNIEPTPFGDKYVLVEHIATGGMAEIYRANYTGIEGFAKELVVKTLRAEFAARTEVVGMFLDEARVAATLTHQNVVHTYDLGEIGGEYFIAMELLKGEELVNVMRRSAQVDRPIPRELSIGIVMQGLEGLHYVHIREEGGRPLGLVHRDINPTNLHIGYDGSCKILDFGIAATRASAVAKKGQVAGKLSYMAPEQLLGHTIDARADIFPIGVMLYELCLGRRLFRGKREEVTRRLLEGDIPAPTFVDPQFPPQLEAIIMKALEVDPAERYQNCDHMFRDLEAFLAEAKLSWTPRRISAMMVELFGAGAPAQVNYEDQYDDLVDEALDFDAFDSMVGGESPDEVPEWARGLEAKESGEKPKKRTIGKLEALVARESGPQPVVPAASSSTSGARPRSSQRAGASGSQRSAPASAPAPAPADPGARPVKQRSGMHQRVEGMEDSGVRRARARPPTGTRPAVTGRHAAGEGSIATTGPLAAVAPDAATGRAFGHSVVTEESRKGAAWVWILALAALGGLVYIAYTLFTSK